MGRISYLTLGLLFGCVTQQPADPTVTARIVKMCLASNYFKLFNGVVVLAVPAASLPISLVNAGVDQVCIDPERFASDVSTVEWLGKNLFGRPQKLA